MRLDATTATLTPTGPIRITPDMSSAQLQQALDAVAAVEDDPAAAVYRRNARDIMSLPGIAGVSFSKATPGVITVTFADEAFRALGDNVLRDVVDGARLVLAAQTPGVPAEWPWWVHSTDQMMNGVRSMPGVVESSTIVEHGQRDVMFRTDSAATTARLRPLISEWLGNWRVSFYHPSIR